MTRCWPNCAPAESALIRSGLFPQLTGLGVQSDGDAVRVRAVLRSSSHRGVPDDELHEWRTAALLGGGDAAPVVDTELVEPEPGRTDLPPRSNAERTTNARRRDIRSQRFRVLGVGENVVVGTPKL